MTTTPVSHRREEEHQERSSAQARKPSRKAKIKRIKRGLLPWALPLGYKVGPRDKSPRIQKDAKTALLVKTAFRTMARPDETLQSTLAKLTNSGLRSRSGYPVSWAGLRYMLNNPFYIGLIRCQGKLYSGCHQPLISHSLFARVQRKLSERQGRRRP